LAIILRLGGRKETGAELVSSPVSSLGELGEVGGHPGRKGDLGVNQICHRGGHAHGVFAGVYSLEREKRKGWAILSPFRSRGH
jgi:hypothetical protein